MTLRCIHRHTFDEHPNCFFNGDVYSEKIWFIEEGYKLAYLDIETTDLNANIGIMLSWAIKSRDGTTIYDVITKDELFNFQFDKRIVKSLLTTLDNYDIIVTYYGTMFDIPFINTRALLYGYDTVSKYAIQTTYIKSRKGELKIKEKVVPKFFHWDLYYTVRNKLSLNKNTLANITEFLGIDGKTHLDKSIWLRARYGDEKALRYVLDHNIKDVKILERLHNRLLGINKWMKKGA